MLTRRRFLRALGIGTGVAVVAPELLVPEEPRKRIWQVGVDLRSGTACAEMHALHQRIAESEHGAMQRYMDYMRREIEKLSGLNAVVRGNAEHPENPDIAWAMDDNGRLLMPIERKSRAELAEMYPEPSGDEPFRMKVIEPIDPGELYVQRVDVDRGRITVGSERPQHDGSLFGIDASAYPEWKAVTYNGANTLTRDSILRALHSKALGEDTDRAWGSPGLSERVERFWARVGVPPDSGDA